MDAAHAVHRARDPRRMLTFLGNEATEPTWAEGWQTAVGHQESGAREIIQSAQNGQGYKMVESAEQQTTRAVVDGSPAYQATSFASATGAD